MDGGSSECISVLPPEAEASPWYPSDSSAFRPFHASSVNLAPPQFHHRVPLVAKLTRDIVETLRKCNPNFRYSEAYVPKRYLTNPAVGVLNDGQDNANSDLILYVNLELLAQNSPRRYIVKEMLGQGTFGQVVKCWDTTTQNYVAVKVIKNQPAYFQQAMVEVSILLTLKQKIDQENHHHIVRILDYFKYQNHLCITFEMLGSNLYELLKANSLRGLSLKIVQSFSEQILKALVIMKDAGIIHCDLKPENILISRVKTAEINPQNKTAEIKVIDFGSACNEGLTVYSYIQSRYYRSPEVLLGHPYTTAIDMWSFGCIVAELFLGVPLFPGASEYDLLKRMMEILGAQPPDSVLRDAKNTSRFFKHVGSIFSENDSCSDLSSSAYKLLSLEEFEEREKQKPVIGKWYIPRKRLEDLIVAYPWRRKSHEEENMAERSLRMALVDFIRGLVEFDPAKRWSPRQALLHPFVTGKPFTSPYIPSPETAKIPVARAATINHNPGGGHFLAAGLSPQVGAVDRCLSSNISHFSKMPLSYGSSYGSLGSYGSYNDNVFHGSSYGSYGEVNNVNMYYSPLGSSGLKSNSQGAVSFLGSSPEIRRRAHIPQGNGYAYSPGSIGHMSVGASPSQFTPPNSQMPGLAGSPGKYGSASAARGSHGSPLGKSAVGGNYNRRRNWIQPPLSMPPHDYISHNTYANYPDGFSCIHSDGHLRGNVGSHNPLSIPGYHSWRPPLASGGVISSDANSNHGTCPTIIEHEPNMLSDKLEGASSTPAVWDPYFCDDSLQEESADAESLSSEFTRNVRLESSTAAIATTSGAGTFVLSQNQTPTVNRHLSKQKAGQINQAFPHGEINHRGVLHSYAGHGLANPQSYHLFGQQYLQHIDHATSNYIHSGRSQQNRPGPVVWPNYGMGERQTEASTSMGDALVWGGNVRHPMGTTFPSSHSRRNYGRIS